ncbi:MAG: magnesium transporter [Candidatus Melainabacteria bacterium]|nr:magnesium transporter [Candidatus Melainabacteria bacterium]
MVEQQTLCVGDLEALLKSGDRQQLRLFLNEQYPADLAEWFSEIDKACRLACFRLLDLDNASAVLAELEPENQRDLLKEFGDLGIVPLISRMSPDDAADLLSELPQDKVRSIISQMTDPEVVQDLEELMTFKEDSAGGIMSTDYLALNSKMLVQEALPYLREMYEDFEEDVYDVYVVDEQERLVGRVTLKELLTAPPEQLVEGLMDTNIVKVSTETDQEEAAEKLSRYDLLSLPVVDSEGRLRGIITADDAFDVLEEEATEDIYQSSGIDITGEAESETLSYNVPFSFRARLPWLIVTLLIETVSATVITRFDAVIKQTIAAASFMPLLSGVTGSVATQSTCIIVRGTATGHINWRAAWRNLIHEVKVGVLLGMACGALISLISMLFHQGNHSLGIIVGISLFVTMTVGVLVGTLIPMIFHRLGIDPAHASGPLITSLLDVSTVTIYLSCVHNLISYLT